MDDINILIDAFSKIGIPGTAVIILLYFGREGGKFLVQVAYPEFRQIFSTAVSDLSQQRILLAENIARLSGRLDAIDDRLSAIERYCIERDIE